MTGRRYIETGGEWKGLNGSERKIEYDGGNTAKGRETERESEGSAWIKRKVCGGRDVSAAEAACLPRPLLALRPALRAGESESRATG